MKVIVILLLILCSGAAGYALCGIVVSDAWNEAEREFRCIFDEIEEPGSKNSAAVTALIRKTIQYSKTVIGRHMAHPFRRTEK